MDLQSLCSEPVISEYSRKLKVCGHPIRLKLLCIISGQQDPCVTNLWTSLGERQPVISQHLSVLKENGVVDSTVHGNRRIYFIRDKFIRDIVAKMVVESGK
ncbi:MAG: metalloregulator ArsR/SmtB family transcription factor [Treponema sp.]|jgi:DNA-binding transcriptional ArsR family regulator|nr:metalloregulator ArsR/SmtB family transcription factor [Treponema sp.]